MANPTWTQHTPEISTTTVSVRFRTAYGTVRTLEVALRVDGRGGLFRVDALKGFGPWEAIDGGEGFSTAHVARKHALRWARMATAQLSLSPKDGTTHTQEVA